MLQSGPKITENLFLPHFEDGRTTSNEDIFGEITMNWTEFETWHESSTTSLTTGVANRVVTFSGQRNSSMTCVSDKDQSAHGELHISEH